MSNTLHPLIEAMSLVQMPRCFANCDQQFSTRGLTENGGSIITTTFLETQCPVAVRSYRPRFYLAPGMRQFGYREDQESQKRAWPHVPTFAV